MNTTTEHVRPMTLHAPSPKEWTDEELLLAYRNQANREAFEELVRRYETELYNYLRNYLGDAAMAEDAFQATFLQVHLKCDRFEEGRKVRPWLYAVAVNQAIDARRRARRHRLISLDARRSGLGSDDEDGGPLMNLVDGDELSPFDRYRMAEEGRYVREAVDQLPDLLRNVVLLIYYQGMKYREAADALGVPVGTVKSRLHAAVNKLNQSPIFAQLASHD